MQRTTVLSLLAVPALLLSACGSGGSDEDKIRSIVKDSAKNPSSVCDNLAPEPLKTIGGKDKCKDLAKDQKGKDVDIDKVTIKGDNATVTAKGGANGTLKLMKIDGDWKIELG